MKKFLKWLTKRPERFYAFALLICSLIIMSIDYVIKFNTDEDWKGVLTEAHGMLLDILVFGILVSIYERIREYNRDKEERKRSRQEKIDRYNEEIEDYRFWNDDEAKMRIIGNVKRLHKLKIKKLDLSECYLFKAYLADLTLKKSNLRITNMNESMIYNCGFINSDMRGIKLKGSHLGNLGPSQHIAEKMNDSEREEFQEKNSVKFNNSILFGADFSNSYQVKSYFTNSKLGGANFNDSYLIKVHFEGAELISKIEGEEFVATFENCELINCTAYHYQREDLKKCGIDINRFNFIDKEVE